MAKPNPNELPPPGVDDELRAFLIEFYETNGKMYQNRSKNLPDTKAIRPKYNGRKPSNLLRSIRSNRLLPKQN